jgi:hypothetical protein
MACGFSQQTKWKYHSIILFDHSLKLRTLLFYRFNNFKMKKGIYNFKIICFSLLSISSTSVILSQNLVPNPSFEEYTECPNQIQDGWLECARKMGIAQRLITITFVQSVRMSGFLIIGQVKDNSFRGWLCWIHM